MGAGCDPARDQYYVMVAGLDVQRLRGGVDLSIAGGLERLQSAR